MADEPQTEATAEVPPAAAPAPAPVEAGKPAEETPTGHAPMKKGWSSMKSNSNLSMRVKQNLAVMHAIKMFEHVLSEMDERRDVATHSRTHSNMGLDKLMKMQQPKSSLEPVSEEAVRGLKSLPQTSFAEITELKGVGMGAFCEVYLAKWEGKQVAVKVLKRVHLEDPVAISDLEGEAELLHRLDSPFVLKAYAAGKIEDQPFVIVQALSSTLTKLLPGPRVGTPIWERSSAIRQWPMHRCVHVSLQLAQALRYCHHEAFPGFAVMHRDLKPDNIGFDADGGLVLMDFGLAKVVPFGTPDEDPSQMTGEVGSTRYMAPEVCLSKPYGPPCEVMSWALITWQLLSYEKPFDEFGVEEHSRRVAEGGARPKLSSKWPEALKTLMAESWDPDPAKRPNFKEVVPRMQTIYDEVLESSKGKKGSTTGSTTGSTSGGADKSKSGGERPKSAGLFSSFKKFGSSKKVTQ